MFKAFVALLGLTLAGCTFSNPVALTQNSSLSDLAKFTVADLQAADADAVANNDAVAHACYPALEQFVQSLPTSGGTVAGAFSAFQKTRDLANGVKAGLPTYLKIGCAPLVMDEQQLINQLALIGAGAAATSGATLVVPVP